MNPDAGNGGVESSAEVELRGLSIYTHHGVSDAEQEVGQRLEFDVSFDVPDCDAMFTDRLGHVGRGDGEDLDALGRQQVERGAQVALGVADVGTEPEITDPFRHGALSPQVIRRRRRPPAPG